MSHAKQCPYVSWYQFNQCSIKSCKQHTTEAPHHCLAVDRIRPEGTKVISDAEIHLYKYKDDKISTRLVQMRRKNATDRVRNLLVLHAFIEHIRENKESGGVFTTPSLTRMERRYPLRIRKLNWQNWMWEYLLDDATWKSFRTGKSKELAEIGLDQLLCIKLTKLEKLLQDFNTGVTPNEVHGERSQNSDNRRSRTRRIIKCVGSQHQRSSAKAERSSAHHGS